MTVTKIVYFWSTPTGDLLHHPVHANHRGPGSDVDVRRRPLRRGRERRLVRLLGPPLRAGPPPGKQHARKITR